MKNKDYKINGHRWTEADLLKNIKRVFRGFTIPQKMFLDWQTIADCKSASKRPYRGDNKRRRIEYACSICDKGCEKSGDNGIQIDHIKPVGGLKSLDDLGSWVKRLFCEAENLRAVCKDCHYKITKGEIK